MVNDLLDFHAGRNPSLRRVSLAAIVDDIGSSLAARCQAQQVRWTAHMPGACEVLADDRMLRRAVWNLASNALDAMPSGGELVITGYQGIRGIELEVADSGSGLSDEVRRRAFEPYFTTKRDRAGLGLALVKRVVTLHGGDVIAANCPEGGAAFTIRLPRRVIAAAA